MAVVMFILWVTRALWIEFVFKTGMVDFDIYCEDETGIAEGRS